MRYLPGTTIEFQEVGQDKIADVLNALFLAGGLSLSQVSYLTGLAPHMIQNWVKRGFVSSPQAKRYSKRQFCRIATINFLKDSFQLDKIVQLIGCLNGRLDDESDDLIDDSLLYIYFSTVISEIEQDDLVYFGKLDEAIQKALADYQEPYGGYEKKVRAVMKVMAVAYAAAKLKNSAEILLRELDI